MKIAVIGAGGVGGYFGGRLAQAGHDVAFVARGEHAKSMTDNGLRIISPLGDYLHKDTQVVDSPLKLNNPELILIGVKAWQVKEIAIQLKGIVTNDTIIIPLQNGVMAAEELLDELPECNVMGGLCNVFSKIKEPGVIEHMSADPTIVFGELDNSISDRSKNIESIFTDAGITSKLSDYIQGDTWRKFMLICLGTLGALTKSNYGVLCNTPELKEMLKQILSEIYTVSQYEGIKLKESIKESTLKITESFSPQATSSMARDLWAGKPSELDYQIGTVVKLAKKHEIEVSTSFFIYHTLLPQELKARNL
ncbi:ketopantoate reductase family protein [Labilibacter marinus]|uniref:ketopantoate reductase family protein n=1 Tax=Labilibacter marinus TaxID=1477105 RepID=UPI00094F9316|nr:2-dehydropantoate 2-reductase [Labilibacter marinus]